MKYAPKYACCDDSPCLCEPYTHCEDCGEELSFDSEGRADCCGIAYKGPRGE